MGDCYYGSYWLIAALLARGADGIFERHIRRKTDFRRGCRLGARDHIVTWEKPTQPAWMEKEAYDQIPDELTLREVKVKGKILITTFLNPKDVSKNELGELYEKRWLVEVDFRAIKTVLQMDILRCKSPEMVEKEIAVHLVGYNLICAVMAQTAFRWQILPRQISFKAAIQLLNAFRERGLLKGHVRGNKAFRVLFDAIAKHRVHNRPGRAEPRVLKRRPKGYALMMKPRQILQKRLLRIATVSFLR